MPYTYVTPQRNWEPQVNDLYRLLCISGKAGRKKWEDGAYICGGYARWIASPDPYPYPPEDIDVYCVTNDSFEYLTSYLASMRPYTEGQRIGKDVVHFDPIPWSERVDHRYPSMMPVQIMSPKFGTSAEEILDGFDFSICKAAIINTTTVLVDSEFEKHETDKHLVLRKDTENKQLLARTLKYMHYGYSPPTGMELTQILGIAKDLNVEELQYVYAYAARKGLLSGIFGESLKQMYGGLLERAS